MYISNLNTCWSKALQNSKFNVQCKLTLRYLTPRRWIRQQERRRSEQTEVRQARLDRRCVCDHERRAAEPPAARQARLDTERERTHERRAAEQPEARQARLERLRERNREQRAAEQAEARQARLAQARPHNVLHFLVRPPLYIILNLKWGQESTWIFYSTDSTQNQQYSGWLHCSYPKEQHHQWPVDRVVVLPCMPYWTIAEDRSCWWRRSCTPRWYQRKSA